MQDMDITSLGHASFKIRTKTTALVTDPFDSQMVGLKFPKHTEANIVTISHAHPDHNMAAAVEGSPFVISGPGEYEVAGIGIVGISVWHDDSQGSKRGKNTMYRFEVDGICIVHCGDLGHVLSTEHIEDLGNVDILMIPVGGSFTIDASQAADVVKEIEPSIVIPMHYKVDGLSANLAKELQPVSVFLEEMGKKDTIKQPKLTITKDKLPGELQVVVLQ